MPGFNIASFDANSPGAKTELHRKHRWRFTAGFLDAGDWVYLKTAARPRAKVDVMEMHHRNDKVRFAGKVHWEPITLVFYDRQNTPAISELLYNWLNSSSSKRNGVYQTIHDPVQPAAPEDYKKRQSRIRDDHW